MADDRPAEDTVERVARLERELEDLRSTVLARVGRGQTGQIEPTVRAAAPAGALLLQGQTVPRTTYAALWQWAQDQSLVISGLFTVGDGSTTFGLPDFRGRVVVAAGTLGTDTYALGQKFGAARHALTVAELATHGHDIRGPKTEVSWDHNHKGNPGTHAEGPEPNDGTGSVFGTETTGSGTAHENRQPSIAINWLVWT